MIATKADSAELDLANRTAHVGVGIRPIHDCPDILLEVGDDVCVCIKGTFIARREIAEAQEAELSAVIVVPLIRQRND